MHLQEQLATRFEHWQSSWSTGFYSVLCCQNRRDRLARSIRPMRRWWRAAFYLEFQLILNSKLQILNEISTVRVVGTWYLYMVCVLSQNQWKLYVKDKKWWTLRYSYTVQVCCIRCENYTYRFVVAWWYIAHSTFWSSLGNWIHRWILFHFILHLFHCFLHRFDCLW